MSNDDAFLEHALRLAYENVDSGNRPFGAVVVKNGEILATGVNEIIATGDPTAHAELLAIRAASQRVGSPDLRGCTVYASGQPCPMCMAAMRLAGISAVVFAHSNDDAEPYGLSTAAIAEDLARPLSEQSMTITYRPIRLEDRPGLYEAWQRREA